MANGISMEDVAFYAKVGPENLKKLGSSSEAAVFQLVVKDTVAGSGCSYSELVAVSGFPAWMVNEAIGSLSGKGFITTDIKVSYFSPSSNMSNVPSSVTAASAAAMMTNTNRDISSRDFLSGNSSSSSLSPEIASVIGVDYSDREIIESHAKKDAKKTKKVDRMNLMDGLSTGRLIDHIGDKNDFGKSMEAAGGSMGSMMEGLSLKMPSIPLDGREMKDMKDMYERDEDEEEQDESR